MLSIMLVALRRRNSPSNSCQLLTHGIWPLSGNPEKMLSRDEENFVSVPCMYGEAAARAIKCGTKRDRPCSR